jgi:hypothetical protein
LGYLGNNALPFDPLRSSGKPLDAQRFNGNGSTTTFTLTYPVTNPTDLEVFVENVQQEPLFAYNATGNQLIFTEAPPSGTNNVYVIYRNIDPGIYTQIPDGAITFNKLANNIRLFTTDNFTGDNTTVAFTLSSAVPDANTLIVAVDGVFQRAPIHYTASGNTITFTSAPPSSSNVHVRHLGFRTTQSITALPANTTISQPVLQNLTATGVSTFTSNVGITGNLSVSGTGGNFFRGNTVFNSTGAGAESIPAIITANGWIGLGTTNPQRYLHLTHNGTGAAEIFLTKNDGSMVANRKTWNILVNNIGAGANAQMQFRQIDDAGSGTFSTIPFQLNAVDPTSNQSYVSFPTHPYFHRYSSSPGSLITGNFRAWNSWGAGPALPSNAYPSSGQFNDSTGVFTVPVSGLYLIGMEAHGDASSGRKIVHLLHSNGNVMEFIETSSPYADQQGTTIYYLVKGDTIRFGDHNTIPMATIGAWGYLIQQL